MTDDRWEVTCDLFICFFIGIGATIRTHLKIQCLRCAGFLFKTKLYLFKENSVYFFFFKYLAFCCLYLAFRAVSCVWGQCSGGWGIKTLMRFHPQNYPNFPTCSQIFILPLLGILTQHLGTSLKYWQSC